MTDQTDEIQKNTEIILHGLKGAIPDIEETLRIMRIEINDVKNEVSSLSAFIYEIHEFFEKHMKEQIQKEKD